VTYSGGWNPQQDPQGGGPFGPGGTQYGPAVPGSGPYGAPPYGTNPYGPGQTAAYPAYGGGFGPPPPPPKRDRLPIVLSVVAILVIVGVVVTIVLINRGEDPAPAAAPSTSKAPTKTSRPPASRQPTSTTRPGGGKNGWSVVNDSETGLSYQVPPDWEKTPNRRDTGLGVQLTQGAVVGDYSCGGSRYFRGFVASGTVMGKEGAPLDLNKVLVDFAESIGHKYYNNPKVDTGTPTPTTAQGKQAATLTVTVTPVVTDANCDASSGEVAIIGLPVEAGGRPRGVVMVVVVNDLAGGPATPPGLPNPLAEEILSTVVLSG
jgi:hypothetical protein